MTDRRFIEDTFPVKEVSAESAREKNIRHGHISTLHIWWARRPLAASRATAYAALVPSPADSVGRKKRGEFIAKLSKWGNSLNPHILERARQDVLEAHAERLSAKLGHRVTVDDIESGRAPRPRILDPFAGGGAIPLEALRLGCDVYASDYNPVAVLILRATLEYPHKYGQPGGGIRRHLYANDLIKESFDRSPEIDQQMPMGFDTDSNEPDGELDSIPLVEAVRHWGKRLIEETKEELAEFYPPEADGAAPIGYIWARTIPCQNPVCGAEIPLMRRFWLAKRKGCEIALRPVVRNGQIDFEIVSRGSQQGANGSPPRGYTDWPEGYSPSEGTVSRAVATCPVCSSTIAASTTRRLFREGESGERMVAVVLKNEGETGKAYRLPTEGDFLAYQASEQALADKRERLLKEWGIDPVPDEPIMKTPSNTMGGTNRVLNYDMRDWKDIYNQRQLLALVTLCETIRKVEAVLSPDEASTDISRALAVYLTIAMGRLASFNARLGWWQPKGEFTVGVFGRQALPMVWDYSEVNPVGGGPGDLHSAFDWIERVLDHCCAAAATNANIEVRSSSGRNLPLADRSFDAVLTDPPYYDNVPYSYLSDFFYVWQKRALADLCPDLFLTPLSPKTDEIVAYDRQNGGVDDAKDSFEAKLRDAFKEMFRVTDDEGVAVVVYTHESTAGWEAVINALLESGFTVTASWPLHTERAVRLVAQASAALASSIYIVARKITREPTGFYREVKEELRRYVDEKLERLWEEGISGADFFIAAIGSAIEVFARYERVIDYEGTRIGAGQLLEDVRTLATDFAVRRILQDGFVEEVSDLTRFYVLWRWNFGEARAPFDEARKLAQSCGLDLTQEWDRTGSFVRKQKEYVRALGPAGRDPKQLAESHELIDALHLALRLWEKGQRDEMVQALATSGFGGREVFYRVAQAVAESLPKESKEKRLLEGFLAGRERVRAEVGEVLKQGKLFD